MRIYFWRFVLSVTCLFYNIYRTIILWTFSSEVVMEVHPAIFGLILAYLFAALLV